MATWEHLLSQRKFPVSFRSGSNARQDLPPLPIIPSVSLTHSADVRLPGPACGLTFPLHENKKVRPHAGPGRRTSAECVRDTEGIMGRGGRSCRAFDPLLKETGNFL
ncbi:hypothetical protein SRHO_G00307180 [Serrasalmus rhombeus]